MRVVRDLFSGQKPAPIELYYCTNTDSSTATTRYRGSLVKFTNFENANGNFYTWAGESTLYENLFGILEEKVSTGDTEALPNHTTAAMQKRKITPVGPNTVVRGEYAQSDPAGTTNLDTNCSGTAASATLVDADACENAYSEIGSWFYFTNGANANYLHYVESHTTTTEKFTLGTALTGAVVDADDFIHIAPAACTYLMLDAHEVTIVSEKTISNRTLPVLGLMSYITDVGIPLQPLDRAKHDGLKLKNPRFYHDFLLIGKATMPNVFGGGDPILRA